MVCRTRVLVHAGLALALVCGGCTPPEKGDGKIHLDLWEKWVRFEGEAMQRVVDAFNASQDRIVVRMSTFGAVDRKMLLATAGGNPPDICGLWAPQVASFADHGALLPLDDLIRRDGLTRAHWIPVFADLAIHRGQMWAVPTTPTTLALHWNKALFREAGLDPERPPRTIEELDAFAERLTQYDAEGNITRMGYLPWEPDWYIWGLGPWFGGTLFDGANITANDPRTIEAYAWLHSYPLRYGADRLNRFCSGFGNFASPQNPFFSGKLAMVIHGVWLHNYLTQYAPGMQYGVAALPRTPHGPPDFSIADMDVLVIPSNVPEPQRSAAWEFLKFVSQPSVMEMLCLGQRKNTPLAEVSEVFVRDHPHPFIRTFIELSKSPHVVHLPQMGIWVRYEAELRAASERVRLLVTNPRTGRAFTPQESLDIVQEEMSVAWARHQESLARRGAGEGRR